MQSVGIRGIVRKPSQQTEVWLKFAQEIQEDQLINRYWANPGLPRYPLRHIPKSRIKFMRRIAAPKERKRELEEYAMQEIEDMQEE